MKYAPRGGDIKGPAIRDGRSQGRRKIERHEDAPKAYGDSLPKDVTRFTQWTTKHPAI
jgi:hypothetical protein